MVFYFHPEVVPHFQHAWPDRRILRLAGVDTDFVYAVIDRAVLAVGNGPDASVYLFPLLTEATDERPDATFIANYISFATESAVLALAADPEQRPSPSWPVAGLNTASSELFESVQGDILEAGIGLRWSPHLLPYLPWDPIDADRTADVEGHLAADVELLSFVPAANALSLYALSIRQADPFAEYLFLYRLFEYISRSNGKRWIEEKLPLLADLEIGPVLAEFDGMYGGVEIEDRFVADTEAEVLRDGPRGRQLIDLSRLIRALAIQRRDTLRAASSDEEIADRLYADQRCGLAHAHPERAFLLHDSTKDVAEILLDLPLVRCLARAAVCNLTDA